MTQEVHADYFCVVLLQVIFFSFFLIIEIFHNVYILNFNQEGRGQWHFLKRKKFSWVFWIFFFFRHTKQHEERR